MRSSVDIEPVVSQTFQSGDAIANLIIENLGSPAGDGIKAGVPQSRNRVANCHAAIFRDGNDLRCRIAVQMNFRKTLLDAAQHLLMPVNLEIRMQASLHQYSGASEFDGFADLLVDGLEIQDVSFFGFRSLEWTIERAKRAVLGAIIRVVDIAINNICDDAMRMQFSPHRVSFHSDANKIIGFE